MSDLLKSFLKPLAVDYLNATNPKLTKEATRKVATIIFILSYKKWELGKLTKLLAQFDYLTADEMVLKIKSIVEPEEFSLINTQLTTNAYRAKGFADRCRRDTQSIVSKWLIMSSEAKSTHED